MSILGFSSSNNGNNNDTSRHSFVEFRKQASFYLKEKIKTARLALTDVTPAQLLTEEATNDNPWAPDAGTLGLISKAAFDVDDYWRIVDILHNKLSKFDRKNWRASYNALIIVERLLTHGPESVAQEFQINNSIIKTMNHFQLIDEKGFNWGLAVRKKSERILKLLEDGNLLKEERNHARKLSREIKGFGSFSGKSTYPFKESPLAFGRSHSQFNEHRNDDNSQESFHHDQPRLMCLDDHVTNEKSNVIKKGSLKENMAPRDIHVWDDSNNVGEGSSLLCDNNAVVLIDEDDHPFRHAEKLNSSVSLLNARIED